MLAIGRIITEFKPPSDESRPNFASQKSRMVFANRVVFNFSVRRRSQIDNFGNNVNL